MQNSDLDISENNSSSLSTHIIIKETLIKIISYCLFPGNILQKMTVIQGIFIDSFIYILNIHLV